MGFSFPSVALSQTKFDTLGLRQYVKPLRLFPNLNTITNTADQTCSLFKIPQLPHWLSSALPRDRLRNCVTAREARAKAKTGIFPLRHSALIRYPHLKGASCY